MYPGYAPIVAKRHQPFVLDVLVPNLDLAAQTPSIEVRANPEAGAALIALGRAAVPGAAGVYLGASYVEGVPSTHIVVSIPRALIEGLPQAKPLGSDLETFYGVKLDGFELFGGPLTWEAQANHG